MMMIPEATKKVKKLMVEAAAAKRVGEPFTVRLFDKYVGKAVDRVPGNGFAMSKAVELGLVRVVPVVHGKRKTYALTEVGVAAAEAWRSEGRDDE